MQTLLLKLRLSSFILLPPPPSSRLQASSNIRFTWSTCTKLATDLALVARHLAGMGVALPEGAGELPPGLKGVADEG